MSLNLAAARAEALFASTLPIGTHSADAVKAAIVQAVRTHGGVNGCAADMAAAYGDRPDQAMARMCWCLATVATAYGRCACDTAEVAA